MARRLHSPLRHSTKTPLPHSGLAGATRTARPAPTVAQALRWFLPTAIALGTFLCFSPALTHDFVNWDDFANFVENPHYRGFGVEHLRWMFTTHDGHYIPLTWLTLALDFKLWGMNARGYHLTNLVLHIANAVLLYWLAVALLRRASADATGDGPTETRIHCAATVAALLHALHPLRVESVAWITERRDVLCGVFVLASVLAYLRVHPSQSEHASSPHTGRIPRPHAGGRSAPHATGWLALSAGLFATSLLCKVLAVTLPLVLLVIDRYPLRRPWRAGLLVEKAPYFAMAIAAGAMGVLSEKAAGAWVESDAYTFWHRLLQPGHRLCFYLGKLLLPVDLSPLYLLWPIPRGTEPRFILGTAGAIVITALTIAGRRRWPAALAVWLSFAILLAPVLGVVQIGAQYAADRFTYLAAIPWALLAGGGLCRLKVSAISKITAPLAWGISGGLLLLLGTLSFRQTGIWKDSLTLWNHALAQDSGLFLGFNNRGLAKRRLGDLQGAIRDYSKALALNPNHLSAYMNRGIARGQQGELDGAIDDFSVVMAKQARPDVAQNLATLLAARAQQRLQRNDAAGAANDFTAALRVIPDGASGRVDLQQGLAQARARLTPR